MRFASILILAASVLAGAASPPPVACPKDQSPSADCHAPKKTGAKKHASAAHSVTYAPAPTVYEPAEAVETVATETPATEAVDKPTRACVYKNGKKVCR